MARLQLEADVDGRNSIDPLDPNKLRLNAKVMEVIFSENGQSQILSEVAESLKNHYDIEDQGEQADAKLIQF